MSREEDLIGVPECVSEGAHLTGMHNYLSMWEKSVDDPKAFWAEQARIEARLAALQAQLRRPA